MKITQGLNLKKRALVASMAILFLALSVNILFNLYAGRATYRDALIYRTTAAAEVVKTEIERTLSAGPSTADAENMRAMLYALTRNNAHIAYALVMDMTGKTEAAGGPEAERGAHISIVVLKDILKRAAESPMTVIDERPGTGSFEKIFPLVNQERRAVGILRVGIRTDAAGSKLQGPVLLSLLVGMLSLLMASGLMYLVIGTWIADPLSTMSRSAERIASGDLTGTVPLSGRADVAGLGTAINTLSANLRDMLNKLKSTVAGLGDAVNATSAATQRVSKGAVVQQEATEQTASTVKEMALSIRGVAENAEALSNSATDASSAVTEMAASIGEIAESSGTLSSLVEQTASSLQQMLASIRQVSENTEALSASAEQTSASLTEMSASVKEVEQRAQESARFAEQVSKAASERGLAAAQEAISGMSNIKNSVEATASVIHRLGKRSQEIGQILKVIDEVTDQTELLALNAAILAAQAGEHGKGFSVIAEEIKELADRTASSTKEIAALIGTVQKDSEESVRAMDKGLQAVVEGAGLVSVTRDVLEQVVESSKKSSATAVSIERTTSEQARGISQVTDAVITITDQIESIAKAMQEQRRGSDQMAKAAERMREIARRVQYATQEQTTGSSQIANSVESVTAQASQIARSTAEQRQGVDQIGTAIASIQQMTQQIVDVSIEIDIAMQSLKTHAGALQAELRNFTM